MRNYLVNGLVFVLSYLPFQSIAHAAQVKKGNLDDKLARQKRYNKLEKLALHQIDPLRKRNLSVQEAWENFAENYQDRSTEEIDHLFQGAVERLIDKGIIIPGETIQVAKASSEIIQD